MSDSVQLGKIIEGDAFRDAIHIAVAPVTAAHCLSPGEHVGLIGDGDKVSDTAEKMIGIVDPFLRRAVAKGERFYLCLYPNTVTGMRHMWTHPAFARVVK